MVQKERATDDPDALEAAGKFMRLVRRAPAATSFIGKLAQGKIDEARAMVDLPEDEFHARVTEIRERAEAAAERHPEIADMSKEEFIERERGR